jgi:predicted ATP-dependent serine protease
VYACLLCATEYQAHVFWCGRCGSQGTVAQQPRRAADHTLGTFAVRSAKAVARAEMDLQTFPDAAPELAWCPGSTLLLHAPPGQGKSWLSMRLAADAGGSRIGLAQYEEPDSATFAHRLRATGLAQRSNVDVLSGGGVEDLLSWCRDNPNAVLVIDSVSVTSLLPEDLRRLSKLGGLRLLIAVAQSTKDGSHRGSQSWAHEVDVVLTVNSLVWTVTKSRFGPTGMTGNVEVA